MSAALRYGGTDSARCLLTHNQGEPIVCRACWCSALNAEALVLVGAVHYAH